MEQGRRTRWHFQLDVITKLLIEYVSLVDLER